jgi:competence protein ComEC
MSFYEEQKVRLQLFLSEYGKVASVLFLFVVSIFCVVWLCIFLQPEKLKVSFLDVGQGDAILIQTPSGHDILVDGGPTREVLAQVSHELGYFDRDIEVMIATHGDADHITGLIPILEKYNVKHIVQSPVKASTDMFEDLESHIESEGANVYVGEKGDVIDFGDGAMLHVLYPNKYTSPKIDTNDASVSFVLTYGEHSVLLTGDLTTKYEPLLLQGVLPKHITVYKAGHHGSKTSSGEQILTYIRPEYSVISAGKDNRYGHPAPEVLERLRVYSQEVLSTIDRGTVTFVSDGRVLEVETEK